MENSMKKSNKRLSLSRLKRAWGKSQNIDHIVHIFSSFSNDVLCWLHYVSRQTWEMILMKISAPCNAMPRQARIMI